MEPFNPKALIDHALYLVSQDETELALKTLDMVPAYYRHNRVLEIEQTRSLIQSRIWTAHDLLSDEREFPKSKEYCINFLQEPRGQLLRQHLYEANNNNIEPQIVDYGAGDFSIPIALKELGFRFKYKPITLNISAVEKLKSKYSLDLIQEIDLKTPVWFVAYEIIEHLSDIWNIRWAHDRHGYAERVFLSTPKFTFKEGTQNWKEAGIHHLRAYTPVEFYSACLQLFPNRKFDLSFNTPVMVAVGS